MNHINKLGLGTVQFGLQYGISNSHGQTTNIEIEEILNFSKENGINTLDTASAYGSSERVLGENDLSEFNIVSKFLLTPDGLCISKQLEHSLNCLKVESLYGYLAHRPKDIIDDFTLWEKLQEFKSRGLVKNIGFSFNEVNEVKEVLDKGFVPDIVQVPYNYLDNRFEEYLFYLKGEGCEVHTRSSFLQGLFFMDVNDLNPFFNEVKPIIKEMQGNGESLPGLLLKYCIDKIFIDKVIFGVNTVTQLKHNISEIKDASKLPPLSISIKESLLIPSQWPV